MKIITFLFFLIGTIYCSHAQTASNNNSLKEIAQMQNAQPYFIQVLESKDAEMLFPKLYPVGYIIKETNSKKKKTKYFLGDFASEQEARNSLNIVKALGYKDAIIVRIDY